MAIASQNAMNFCCASCALDSAFLLFRRRNPTRAGFFLPYWAQPSARAETVSAPKTSFKKNKEFFA